jgi:DNA uptake protein ComE-like DNA-binding protein
MIGARANIFRDSWRPCGPFRPLGTSNRARGSVLIIVMWICLGLVALTLYFASSMSSELRAADNRGAEVASRQAIAGATRYATYILKQYAVGGVVPEIDNYKAEAVPVGAASFWFIGRATDSQQLQKQTNVQNEPYFALVDESSKLNLNTATAAMIQALPLPDMTPDFAAAVVAWRSANSANAQTQDGILSQLNPPRHNKGAPYETVDEIRLINEAALDLLVGEDTNRNGVLDPNEDDGELSAPRDDQNGQLLAGLLEYVTVYSSQPTTSASGTRRTNVTTLTTPQARNTLSQLLVTRGITQQRAQQMMARITNTTTLTSVADFMVTTQVTAAEFALIHTDLTAAAAAAPGLINVNTASEAVLTCIPGIGADGAATLVAYRAAHPEELTSMAWLTAAGLTAANIRRAGTYITDQSYQFSADIAAVGATGRGYCREKVVFDVSTGTPRIVNRQDLTAFGWALGTTVKRTLNGTKDI